MFPPRHLSDDSHKWDNCSMEHSCTLYLKFSKIYPILDILFSNTSLFYIVILQLGHTIKLIIYSFFGSVLMFAGNEMFREKLRKYLFVSYFAKKYFRKNHRGLNFIMFFFAFFQIPFFSAKFLHFLFCESFAFFRETD